MNFSFLSTQTRKTKGNGLWIKWYTNPWIDWLPWCTIDCEWDFAGGKCKSQWNVYHLRLCWMNVSTLVFVRIGLNTIDWTENQETVGLVVGSVGLRFGCTIRNRVKPDWTQLNRLECFVIYFFPKILICFHYLYIFVIQFNWVNQVNHDQEEFSMLTLDSWCLRLN